MNIRVGSIVCETIDTKTIGPIKRFEIRSKDRGIELECQSRTFG